MNSITLTISSETVGFGHLKRMRIFKDYLKKKKIKNDIFYFGKKNLFNNFNCKISFLFIKKKILSSGIDFIVIDFSNTEFFKNFFFKKIIKLLLKKNIFLVIFNDNSKILIKNFINKKKNILIYPYATQTFFKDKNKSNYLVGVKYSVLKENKIKKDKKNDLKKIIISCGGADFKKLTLKIYNVLKKFNKIQIGIVIGPNFKKDEIEKILKLKNKKNIKIYQNLNNLSKVAYNYDLAIITSGLTKYELASIRMNFAVVSENEFFAKQHKPFAELKLGYEIGVYDDPNKFDTKISYMIKNYKKIFFRKKNNLIDFNGAYRIIKQIKKKIY